MVDGLLPHLCPRCGLCPLGIGCDGSQHPALIAVFQPGFHVSTYSFLARLLRRLASSDMCRYSEVMDPVQFIARINS